jgi:hypothetical protein
MKPNHLYKISIAIAVVLGLSLASAEFYSVRELAAALIIFSVLFGAIGIAFLILILIQDAALRGVAYVEARLAWALGASTVASNQQHADPMLRNPRWN